MRGFRAPVAPALLTLALFAASCGRNPAPPPPLRLATTTSTRDSGLLDHLLPLLERDTGVRVAVLAVGSGQALRIGAEGDADLLLTHDPAGEEELVASGAAVDRRSFMYNDFVLAGPAGALGDGPPPADAREALRRIASAGVPWLSRGDDSGTHRKERRLWREAGVEPGGAWCRETGQGMGATLSMAAELGAVTLTDRATLTAHAAAPELTVLFEGDPALRNPYAVLLVDPARHPHVRGGDARRAADWLTGPAGRAAIEAYRLRGRQVFFLLSGD